MLRRRDARRVLNRCLSVATLVLLGFAALSWILAKRQTTSRGVVPGSYIDAKLVVASRHCTLLVVLSSNDASSEDASYFRRLARGPHAADIVFASPVPADVLQQRLAEAGVNSSGYVSVTGSRPLTDRYPAFILVDGTRRVRSVWRGRLPPEGQRAIDASLRECQRSARRQDDQRR